MNVLDGDNLRLSYEGKYAERNIVQVMFNKGFLSFKIYLKEGSKCFI